MNFYEMDGGRICRTFKDDCVIRSISIAMKKPYSEIFSEMMALGLEMGAYPSHYKVWVKYLEDRSWVKHKPPRSASGKLIKLKNWENPPAAAVIKNCK